MSSSNQTNPQNPARNTQQEQPGLLSGHAEYIKGSAEVSPQTSRKTSSNFSSSSSSSSGQEKPEPRPSSQSSSLFLSSSSFPSSSSSSSPPFSLPPSLSPPSTTTPTPTTSLSHLSSNKALHERNRQLRKTKRIRDSRGHHADVLFVANLTSCEQSAIGSITGSHAWTSSGEQDKAHARANLKTAAGGRDTEGKGFGHVEEVAGRWTGCEGMKEEGKASAERARRQE